MWMQNYAKFDSRISEDSLNISQSVPYDYYWNSSYFSNIINDIIRLISNLIELLYRLVSAFLILFIIFFFIYIFISLVSRWWEKTLEDIKNVYKTTTKLISKILLGTKNILINSWKYVLKKKFLFISLFVVLLFINFLWNIINWSSKILRLTKIENSYVWVDLKNDKILSPGYHLYMPIKTNFFLSPTNNFDFEIAEVTANTSEDLWVILDYRVWFKLVDGKRLDFYKKYSAKNIQLVSSDIVMPRLLEVIKSIIKWYSFKDISSKHSEIKNITIEEANKVLNPIWIDLQEINILDIRLPETYLKSKEQLLNAENELKLAEAKLEAQKKESEKKLHEAENLKKVKIIEAEAIAEYNKIVNSQDLNDKMIEIKELENEELKIQKWDWKLPTSIWEWFNF
jgi:regulator of protease activity HflC (stomatin/prohibitin superfamily)